MDEETEVVDLDVLRPKKKNLKLDGKLVDVSFIPCGITFDVDRILEMITKISQEYEQHKNEHKTEDGANDRMPDEMSSRAFDLSVQLCALFASVQYPSMNEQWFRKNVDPVQVSAFVEHIKEAMIASYIGVSRYGKK